MTIVAAIALCISAAVIGQRSAQLIFRVKANMVESTFIGLAAISSLLSLVYCFSTISLVHALIAIMAIALPLTVVGGYRGLVESMNAQRRVWVAQLLLSGVGVVLLYLLPVISNMQEVSAAGGVLLAHIDLFTHTAIINQIALQSEIGNTQILFSGATAPIYHYGMYIVPAILSMLGEWRAIDLMIYGVLPFGILALWSQLNEMIATLSGTRGWNVIFIALGALLAADASRAFLFNNALFDLPYLLAASPGAIYGLCIFLLATKAVLVDGRFRFLPFIFCTFLLFGFRALYIPLYVSFSLFMLLISLRLSGVNKLIVMAAVVLMATAAGQFLDTPVIQFHTFMTSFFDSETSAKELGGDSNRVLAAIRIIAVTLGGTLLLLVAVAGVLSVLHRKRRAKIDVSIRLLLAIILAYYCVLQGAIVLRNGDITELMQRPFVVLNVVGAALLMSMLYEFLRAEYLMRVLAAVLLANIFWQAREYGYPKDHSWHQLSYKVNVEKDIIGLSTWLAAQEPGTSYALVPPKPDSYSVYPEAIITALSAKPALVSRLGHHASLAEGKGSDVDDRLDHLNQAVNCRSGGAQERRVLLVSKGLIPCMEPKISIGSYRVY